MANYAHIEEGVITGRYDLVPENWRNISNLHLMKDDEEFMRSIGWRTVQKITPTYNSDTQRLGNPQYEIIDDEVIETIEVIDLPVESPPPALSEEELSILHATQHDDAMMALRQKRDMLLTASDYTQLADIIKKNGEALTLRFEKYRQSLRDLPALYNEDMSFLSESSVVYPTLPTLEISTPPADEGTV
jgi:hypothetical protein